MTPIIRKQDDFKNVLLNNVIASFNVWNDELQKFEVYYYKKSCEKEEKVEVLKQYRGSSRGNNNASPELLAAIKKSSRPPEIEILEKNVHKTHLGFLEQKATMLHNFPKGGHNSDDCFNKKFPTIGGSESSMKSHIALEKLQDALNKHFDPNDPFEFPKGFTKKERIKFLKDNNLYVQSRWEESSDSESVKYYTVKMNETLSGWKGELTLLMPNNIGDERILDGNQSGEACIKVPDMDGLNDIRIPYEWHYLINETDLQTLGNRFNAEPEDRKDYVDEQDILKNLRNKIKTHNLIDDKGLPFQEHIQINEVFAGLNKSIREIKWYLNTVKTEYKNEIIENKRIQSGFYNFHHDRVKKEAEDNRDKKKWYELLKPIFKNKYDLIHQFTIGFEEKINKKINSYKLDEKNNPKGLWPKKTLSLITYRLEEHFINDKKLNEQKYKNTIISNNSASKVTIVLVNPNGKEYYEIN
jgi:hypothetical protein